MTISHQRTQRKQRREGQNPFNSLFSPRSLAANSSAFTLLEMMMTLAVFILLVAAVFALMTGTLQSASTLQDNQNRKDETSALEAYIKRQLTSLPVASTIVSYQRGDGEGLVQNGILFGTINLATALDATIQPNGLYTLRVSNLTTGASTSGSDPIDARQSLLQSVTTNDPALVWTSLMTDVKTIDWKFLDFNQTQWVELWSSGTKPNLVEFDFQPAGDLNGTTMDFWVPKIDPVPVGGGAGGATGGGGGGNNSGQQPRARAAGTPTRANIP
jgi:type II secretory pathway pseudopilin PulG